MTNLTLLFWNAIPKGVSKIEDLQNIPGAVLCYEPGSSSENFLKQFPNIERKPLASVSGMLMNLKYGKALCAILEPAVAFS